MSTPRSAAAHAKHLQRLTWLREHPLTLTALPSWSEDVTPEASVILEYAARQMKAQKLFTARANAREGIRRCVSEIRGEAIAPIGSF